MEKVLINNKEFYLEGLIIEIVKKESKLTDNTTALYKTRSGQYYVDDQKHSGSDKRYDVLGIVYLQEFDKTFNILSSDQNTELLHFSDESLRRIATAFNEMNQYRNTTQLCIVAEWYNEQQEFSCGIYKKEIKDYTDTKINYSVPLESDKKKERKVVTHRKVNKNLNENGLTEREQALLDKLTTAITNDKDGYCTSQDVIGKDLSQLALLSTLKTKGKIDTRKEGSGKNKVTIITLK